jgi:hypothetical protein
MGGGWPGRAGWAETALPRWAVSEMADADQDAGRKVDFVLVLGVVRGRSLKFIKQLNTYKYFIYKSI